MKLLILLFVIALALGSFAADAPQAPEQKSTSSPDADGATNYFILHSDGSENNLKLKDPNHRYLQPHPEAVTCLKMRSYFMAREGTDSDETTMVGYTTCTPAFKFDVKRTVDPPAAVTR